jgi:hypothetical protein
MFRGKVRKRGIAIVALLAAALLVAALGPGLAPAKKKKSKVRNPGTLVTATSTTKLDKVDDRTRMEVMCPGSKEPYGGGFLTSPEPSLGQGVYPNSYERLGQQSGYHITANLINLFRTQQVEPRNVTLQVRCGKKIGPIDDPHSFADLGPGDGPKTVIAKCPKKQTLIGGGYQQTNGVTDGGVIATESHRTSARTWQVVAYNPGGFAGTAVAIGYCVKSKKSVITELSGTATIDQRQAGTATTPPCPKGRQLVFSGFSVPPDGSIRFVGEGFNPDGSTSATGINTGPSATLTAYSYCLRV